MGKVKRQLNYPPPVRTQRIPFATCSTRDEQVMEIGGANLTEGILFLVDWLTDLDTRLTETERRDRDA